MTEHPTVQNWLADAGARSLRTVRLHVAAETTADTDAICATVSRDVFFAVPQRTQTGNEIPPGTVLTSFEEVRDYYANRADSYVVLASNQLKQVSTDWYVFNESAATLRATGAIGNADTAGKEFVVNSAILFPTAEDGIRGEICITRHPFEDVAAGRVPEQPMDASFPVAESAHARLLDALLARLQDGHSGDIEALLGARHSLAVRLDDGNANSQIYTAQDGLAAAKVLSQLVSGADDVALISRLVAPWYVFAEYAVSLHTGGIRHLALLHSVEGERLTSSFGYGFEGPASR